MLWVIAIACMVSPAYEVDLARVELGSVSTW